MPSFMQSSNNPSYDIFPAILRPADGCQLSKRGLLRSVFGERARTVDALDLGRVRLRLEVGLGTDKGHSGLTALRNRSKLLYRATCAQASQWRTWSQYLYHCR